MSDTSSNDATSMEARVTMAGEAIAERVQSATAATAAAAGHAQKIVEDAAAATAAAASQAKQTLGDAGEATRQAWSQAGGGVAEDVVDAGRRATKIDFAADQGEAADGGSGRLRARLPREFVDS